MAFLRSGPRSALRTCSQALLPARLGVGRRALRDGFRPAHDDGSAVQGVVDVGLSIGVEGFAAGVSVVVLPHGDERDLRIGGAHEPFLLPGRSVVGHDDCADRRDARSDGVLDVAIGVGHDEKPAGGFDADHEGILVGVAPQRQARRDDGGGESCRRAEAGSGADLDAAHLLVFEHAGHGARGLGRIAVGACPRLADRDAVERVLQGADVVVVVVGNDEEVDAGDACGLEACADSSAFGADVDEDGRSGGAGEQGRALADVALDGVPVGGDGLPDHRGDGRERQGQGEGRDESQRAPPAPEQEEGREHREAEGCGLAQRDSRSGPGREGSGHGVDPPCQALGHGHESAGRAGPGRGRERRSKAEDGQGRCGRGDERVGGDAPDGAFVGEQEQDRRAGDLGGQRDGHHLGCGGTQAFGHRDAGAGLGFERLGDVEGQRLSQQHDACRRRRREQEAVGHGEPGIGQARPEQAYGEGSGGLGRALHGQADERHGAHDGCAHDGGFRTDQSDEAGQGEGGQGRAEQGPAPAEQGQDESDGDGHMSSGDGDEVGQLRHLHRFGQVVGDARVVSEGHAGNEALGMGRAGGENRGQGAVDGGDLACCGRARSARLQLARSHLGAVAHPGLGLLEAPRSLHLRPFEEIAGRVPQADAHRSEGPCPPVA